MTGFFAHVAITSMQGMRDNYFCNGILTHRHAVTSRMSQLTYAEGAVVRGGLFLETHAQFLFLNSKIQLTPP